MLLALGNEFVYSVPVHLWIIHVAIPDGKRSTWRRSNQPSWFKFVYEASGLIAVSALVEIPWLAIGFQSPNVQSCQALNVQSSARTIGFITDASSAKHLDKSRWRILSHHRKGEEFSCLKIRTCTNE